MKKETTYLQHVRNKNIVRIILNNQCRTLNTKRRIYTRKTRKLTRNEVLDLKESGDYKELTFDKVMKILKKIRLTWLIPVMRTKQLNLFQQPTLF